LAHWNLTKRFRQTGSDCQSVPIFKRYLSRFLAGRWTVAKLNTFPQMCRNWKNISAYGICVIYGKNGKIWEDMGEYGRIWRIYGEKIGEMPDIKYISSMFWRRYAPASCAYPSFQSRRAASPSHAHLHINASR
jgi:hypothetical protein